MSLRRSDLCQIFGILKIDERKIYNYKQNVTKSDTQSISGASLFLRIQAAFVMYTPSTHKMTHLARVMKILIIHIDCIIRFSSPRRRHEESSSAKSHFRIIK